MIGASTLQPSVANAIWVANVLTFSLLYWQIDRGGPYARASKSSARRQSRLPRPNPSSTHLKRIVDFVTKNRLLAMYAGEPGPDTCLRAINGPWASVISLGASDGIDIGDNMVTLKFSRVRGNHRSLVRGQFP